MFRFYVITENINEYINRNDLLKYKSILKLNNRSQESKVRLPESSRKIHPVYVTITWSGRKQKDPYRIEEIKKLPIKTTCILWISW